jgi:hypothetical protein
MTPGGCQSECWMDASCWALKWYENIDQACDAYQQDKEDSGLCEIESCEECITAIKSGESSCAWNDSVYFYCASDTFKWDGTSAYKKCYNLLELEEASTLDKKASHEW